MHVVYHGLKCRGQQHNINDNKLRQDRSRWDSSCVALCEPTQSAQIFAHGRGHAGPNPHHRTDSGNQAQADQCCHDFPASRTEDVRSSDEGNLLFADHF